MSAHWAAPGVKCVCLESHWKRGRSLSLRRWLLGLVFGWPVRGGVYVITVVSAVGPEVFIELKGWEGVSFRVENFRPLISERERQDIALFAPLLDPKYPVIVDDAPVRERAP